MKKILTEWRKFLKESNCNEGDNYQFPEKVYYGTGPSKLDSLRDTGISKYSSDSELEMDREGIPVSNNPFDAAKFGNLVLEIDGQYLSSCGHYSASPNSNGSRVLMRDSSSLSGSGVDSMVDSLGANIPFGAVTGLVFKSTPNVSDLKSRGYASLPMSVLPATVSEEMKTVYEPEEKMER